MHMIKTVTRETRRPRHIDDSFVSESQRRVRALVEQTVQDPGTMQSLFFSTGVVDRVERQLKYGCSIVGDSNLITSSIDRALLNRFPVRVDCFIDAPIVNTIASQKRITRAEVAMEQALTLQGPKLIVVGSAPMALNRILQMHHTAPLSDVVLVAACTGFANVVELKERVWESGLPCIVVRGRKGGVQTAAALVDALLRDASNQPI